VSGDGTRLAASPGAYIGAHDVGQVQIYEIAGQVGAEIVGLDGTTFRIGRRPKDGTIVAVGALTGSSGAGYVSLSSERAIWDQVGQTIEGGS
jgi:hypothetical protein